MVQVEEDSVDLLTAHHFLTPWQGVPQHTTSESTMNTDYI
jgi:hypothetical protein